MALIVIAWSSLRACGNEAILLLLVDLSEEGFVEEELLFVHLCSLLHLLLIHLVLQKVLVVLVNLFDLLVQASLLLFIVLLVLRPHCRLLVVQCLLHVLTPFLFVHLLVQETLHILLSLPELSHPPLILHPLPEFFLHLIPLDLALLIHLSLVHILDHRISHLIHEVLGSLLSRLNLVQTIFLLLLQHSAVFLLG